MPARKRAAAFETSRLTVLASADEGPFLAYCLELIASSDRLAREAAVDALVERPLPAARTALLALYDELDADGLKRDQGARMRTGILRVLRKVGDVRDTTVALRACDTREVAFGDDIARMLRAEGLKLLAAAAPDLFPYVAVEHFDDAEGQEGEPANTAFQLLANGEDFVPIYQWLIGAGTESPLFGPVFELFRAAPNALVQRFVAHSVESAVRRGDEPLCTLLAETIVDREIESAYAAIGAMLQGKISKELYSYVAMILAATNRPSLLAILEHELFHGRQRALVVDALSVRRTPEQEAILRRWDERD